MIDAAIATVADLLTDPDQVRADRTDRTELITDVVERTIHAVYAAGHAAGRAAVGTDDAMVAHLRERLRWVADQVYRHSATNRDDTLDLLSLVALQCRRAADATSPPEAAEPALPAKPAAGSDPRDGVFLSREQLQGWAGRDLDDDDLYRLGEAVGNSSVPEAVAAIVEGFHPLG